MAETKGGFTTESVDNQQKPGETKTVPDNPGQRAEQDTSTLAPGVPKPQPGGPDKPAGSPPSSSTTNK